MKVSMDGAPYLRKIDLRLYTAYPQLLQALENMFNLTIGKQIITHTTTFFGQKLIKLNFFKEKFYQKRLFAQN